MTDTLADALPREIARVSAKRDRWRDMMKEHPELASGMALGVGIMEHEIQFAVKACAAGDVAAMMHAYEALQSYSDED